MAVANLATKHMRQVLWIDNNNFEGSGLAQFRHVPANTKIENIIDTFEKHVPPYWTKSFSLRDAIAALHHRLWVRINMRDHTKAQFQEVKVVNLMSLLLAPIPWARYTSAVSLINSVPSWSTQSFFLKQCAAVALPGIGYGWLWSEWRLDYFGSVWPAMMDVILNHVQCNCPSIVCTDLHSNFGLST